MKSWQEIEQFFHGKFEEYRNSAEYAEAMSYMSGSRRATDDELSQLDFGFYNEKYNFDGWDSDAQPPEPKCRHNWAPTLLLNHTVYDCKHCGAKKELVDKI